MSPELDAARAAGAPRPAPDRADGGFAAGMADLVQLTQQLRDDPPQLLQVIVDGAVALIPGAESASASTMPKPGRLQAHATSGELAPLMLAAQNEVEVGPCFDVIEHGDQLYIEDTRTDRRWPEFTSLVAEHGVLCMLCTPLVADGRVFGSLSLMATQPGVFGEEAARLARIFSVHAAVAVAGGVYRTDFDEGLQSRDVIGRAKGILMERFHTSDEVAFAVLVRASRDTNTKLRDICQHLCDTGELR